MFSLIFWASFSVLALKMNHFHSVYKVFPMHFCVVAKHCFPIGFPSFSKVVQPYRESLIIPIIFASFESTLPEMTSESCIFLRVYKVSGTSCSDVAKHCFPNGFLDLLEGPWDAPARCDKFPRFAKKIM